MGGADVVVGASFGAGAERSAIVVVQRVERVLETFDHRCARWNTSVAYHIPRLERSPRGTGYPELAAQLERLAQDIRKLIKPQRLTLVADISASGRPVIGLLRAKGLKPAPVAIVESLDARAARGLMQLPRRELVSVLSIALSEQRVKVAEGAPEAAELVKALQGFRLKPPAPDVWREGEGEDLVRATGIACWWGERRLSSLAHQPPPPRTAPPAPKPWTVQDMIERHAARRPARVRI